LRVRFVETPVGRVRVVDTATDKPCVVIVPDGPNVIEHYAALIERLSSNLRVVCFDMPGFGFSTPEASYRHSLDQGVAAVIGVLDQLGIARATLSFSCANGLYALRASRIAPERIRSLFLSQTPSLRAMLAWSEHIIPRPLHVPVVGQLSSWLSKRQLAMHWYEMALPHTADHEAFRGPARRALAEGACFSLASVVQGLSLETQVSVEEVTVPCTLLWGRADRTHRRTDPQSLLECAKGAEIVTIDGVAHFPDLEQPERFATLLEEHIALHA
jgi:pimeloyl-ACP methyl ester carboxylesterase